VMTVGIANLATAVAHRLRRLSCERLLRVRKRLGIAPMGWQQSKICPLAILAMRVDAAQPLTKSANVGSHGSAIAASSPCFVKVSHSSSKIR
jgi:hypothetical protein